MKDWNGNDKSLFIMNGDSNHSENERAELDYYATPSEMAEYLLKLEPHLNNVWECACGEGNLSKALKEHGYNVFSSDLVDRGYQDDIIDFLETDNKWFGDIITNPPFKYTNEFIKKSLDSIDYGNKVAMFLKINYLLSLLR